MSLFLRKTKSRCEREGKHQVQEASRSQVSLTVLARLLVTRRWQPSVLQQEVVRSSSRVRVLLTVRRHFPIIIEWPKNIDKLHIEPVFDGEFIESRSCDYLQLSPKVLPKEKKIETRGDPGQFV